MAEPYSNNGSSIDVQAGKPFVLKVDELEELFADADGDKLTYWVKIGQSPYLQVQDKLMYIPEEGENSLEIMLKANDGTADSAEYAFMMNVFSDVAAYSVSENKLLDSLIIHSGFSPTHENVLLRSDDSYTGGQLFNPQIYDYKLGDEQGGNFSDLTPSLQFRAVAGSETVKLVYQQNKTKEITWSGGLSIFVTDLLTAGKNEFQIFVGDSPQPYRFHVDVKPTLKNLSVAGTAYWNSSFDGKVADYSLEIPQTTEILEFSADCFSEGCTLTYNGQESAAVDVSDCDKVEVTVSKDGISNTYTVKLQKQPVSKVKFVTEPAEAVLTVSDHTGAKLQADEDGCYSGMFSVHEYRYRVTLGGYVTAEGIVPSDGGEMNVVLQKVSGEQPKEVNAEWKNFRGSDNNMAIVDVALPKEHAAARWIKDFDNSYPSVEIIVDDSLVVMCGKMLYKLDLESGEVLQSAEMAAAPNFGYTPPTYGAGMIFCPLSSGTIQAFNAETLESLWIYKDSIGGQSLSPITYSDGCIYTGFWKREEGAANYVCIDVTDEDSDTTDESKTALWTYKQEGGFYWAGSVVVGNAVIVGSDDGAEEGSNGTSNLYSFDKKSGAVISALTLNSAGDQRSSIAYDSESGRIYFTTKGGYLYSAEVDPQSGALSDLKCTELKMQSTSTPVVYQGRVYFGMGNGFGTGYLAVADAETMELLFRVKMKGYPQGSVLLTTAYETEGYLYLYMTYNNRPGGISLIKVKKDCSSAADAELLELYDAAGYEEYCITSLICDSEGTIYYKNDSGCIFAIAVPTYQNVIDLINGIGTVSKESEGMILAARAAYNALDQENQAKVSNYSKLTAAEETLNKLKKSAADEVKKLITAIGTVSLHSKDKIEAARKAYDKLTAEEKLLVANAATLTEAEKQYDRLVNSAVANVEILIEEIGDVTKESQAKISAARNAYEQLSEELKELVQNYDVLLDAEKAFKAIAPSGTGTQLAPTTSTPTTTTQVVYTGTTTAPTKSELLQMKEDLENVDENTSCENALEFLKVFYSLDESDRLALEDSDGLKKMQDIVAKNSHSDAASGISAEGLEWNIRIVAKANDSERVRDDMEERLKNAELLGFWNIYLEDVLTGQRHTLEDTLKLKIPLKLLAGYGEYEKVSIVHYNELAEIEVLNSEISGEYIQCDVVEFSYYAVAGFNEVESGETDVVEEAETPEETGDSSWILWAALAAAGAVSLLILAYLRFFRKEEQEETVDEVELK